jgi:hypothetical protein
MAVNFLDNVSIDGDVTIGPVASSAGLLHVSAGTSGDARVVIHADTDNSDENDVPQIWFKADGDITEGLIGLNNNYLDFVSNVNALGGFRYFTGTTNNSGIVDPYLFATEKMRLTNTGNLGIGNTAPTEKLQVNGTVRATSYKSSDGSAGITATVGVKNSSQSQNRTLTIKNGIVTGISSDRRLKTNITLIGTSDSGINIYTFEYKYKFSTGGIGLFQGVMSDEVPAEAVSVDHHGFDVVDYSLIDVEFRRVSI